MKTSLHNIIRELIYQELAEISTTGTGGTSLPGIGAQYMTTKAFNRNTQKDNLATNYLKKAGYIKVNRPKRPTSTKLFDYLQEGEASISTGVLNKKVADVMKTHFSWVKTAEERETIEQKIKDAFTQAYKLKGFIIKEDI